MGANQKFKDSVFSSYFSNPKRLIEVYNALDEKDLPADTPVHINTLTEVFFMNQVNYSAMNSRA